MAFAVAGEAQLVIVGVNDVDVSGATYPAGMVIFDNGPSQDLAGLGLDGVGFRAAGTGTGITTRPGVVHMTLKQFRSLLHSAG